MVLKGSQVCIVWISTSIGRSPRWQCGPSVAILKPRLTALHSVNHAEDLNRALALLGLEQMPPNPAELARSVIHRHPAAAVWSAEQSWAYRVVWNRFITSSGTLERHSGRR